MITEADLTTSVSVLRRHGARLVILFGSAIESPATAADLDLACAGVPSTRFYRAVGELLRRTGKPVDLLDLERHPSLAQRVLQTGRVLYDAR